MEATLKRDIAKGFSCCLVSLIKDLKSILLQHKKKVQKDLMGTFGDNKSSLDHLKNRNFGVNLTSKLSLAVTRSRSNWFRRGSKINEIYRT